MGNRLYSLRLVVVGGILFVIHFVLNLSLDAGVPLSFIASLHSFFLLFLILIYWIVDKKSLKNYDRIWVIYIGGISIKFFSLLAYIYLLKSVYDLSKDQALLHVFLWFFAYLIVEIQVLMKILKINKRVISKK